MTTGHGTSSTKTFLLVAFLALMAVTLACGKSTSFNVTLKESNVFRIVQAALDYAEVELPVEISDVDIRDGVVRVTGSFRDEDGATATGSVDLAVSAQDGTLKAEIVGTDITGIELTEEQIAEFNDILSREFNEAAASVEAVEITSVTVVEDAIKIRVRVGLPD